MPDYGHDLQFGTFLTPAAQSPGSVLALARLTEQSGLDLVSVQDHPYQSAFLDAWTLLSVIGARTERITVTPNVANLPLRPPAVLARSAASLDLLTGGRVELGLGAGAFWDAIGANGGPRRSPGEAVQALEEAIEIIRALWDPAQRGVKVEGRHYQVSGAKPGPAPAHPIGMWIGAVKPRMLRLTGRLADGWLPSAMYLPPDQLAERNDVIDAAAVAAGRSPADVRRLYNIAGSFTGSGAQFLQGGPQVWVEQLAELALTEGMSTFILAGDDPEDIRRFAAEVVPGVRELVNAERASAAAGEPAARHTAGTDGTAAPNTGDPDGHTRGTGFAPAPTPDDGVRLSGERLWEEHSRPTAPRTDGRSYTAHEQAAGQHLIDVHDMLRRELSQVRDIVDQVAAGQLTAGTARARVNEMTMRQNNWTLGAYCESYCRIVDQHHTLEDRSVFPHLRRSEDGLAPVVDRLEEEHRVIHEVLERVDRALVTLVSEPGRVDEVQSAVDLLTDTLLSHLSYEERELVEPLARHGYY